MADYSFHPTLSSQAIRETVARFQESIFRATITGTTEAFVVCRCVDEHDNPAPDLRLSLGASRQPRGPQTLPRLRISLGRREEMAWHVAPLLRAAPAWLTTRLGAPPAPLRITGFDLEIVPPDQ